LEYNELTLHSSFQVVRHNPCRTYLRLTIPA